MGRDGKTPALALVEWAANSIGEKIMKAKETMIAWTPADHTTNPTHGQVKCGQWPDVAGWSEGYDCTDLACWSRIHKMSNLELQLMCYLIAVNIIVRDKIDPVAVDAEMSKIDEYKAALERHPARRVVFL